jgi:hypothetical protein
VNQIPNITVSKKDIDPAQPVFKTVINHNNRVCRMQRRHGRKHVGSFGINAFKNIGMYQTGQTGQAAYMGFGMGYKFKTV